MAHVERSLEVRPHDRREIVRPDLVEQPLARDARVVDEDVQPSVRLDRRSDDLPGFRVVGDGVVVGGGLAAVLADERDRVVGGRGAAARPRSLDACVVDDDARAFGGERDGVRAPDAAPCAGHDGDLPREPFASRRNVFLFRHCSRSCAYGMNGAFVSPPITVDGSAASSSSSVHGAPLPASR